MSDLLFGTIIIRIGNINHMAENRIVPVVVDLINSGVLINIGQFGLYVLSLNFESLRNAVFLVFFFEFGAVYYHLPLLLLGLSVKVSVCLVYCDN